MGTFKDWLKAEKDAKTPEKPGEFKPDGGIHPTTEEDVKKFKHADLIVLPNSVEGTNCGNCSFATDKSNGMMHCKHPDLGITVTERMCCKYWDHKDVKRNWTPHKEYRAGSDKKTK
jgi:hypothetical protein